MLPVTDTIAALATPVGTSAIAVVRVSGPQTAEVVRSIFGAAPPPRQAQHADYRDRGGVLVDDVLFTWFAGPNSFTGEDTLEISSHGNPFIAQKILEDLFARGCRPSEAGEFSKRAFLNGRLDLSQAEAVMDLIHARSERALAVANQQLRGSLGRKMESLIALTVSCLANIEAYIDFPDEDLPPEDRKKLAGQLEVVLGEATRLLATSHYGDLLRHGIKTVIIGEPNAGKSSLLNRLVGRERALVSPEPGTTRDYIEELLSLGQHTLRLVDTAGLNPSPTSLERRGIERTYEQASQADLFLWVVDSARPMPALPAPLLDQMSAANSLAVFNKSDLAPESVAILPRDIPVMRVSAKTGAGIEDLKKAIVRYADSFRTETGDEVIAINARHSAALEVALSCLKSALVKITDGSPSELIASDIREVLSAFGEISGKVGNERILDQLFANFCIGK